MEAHAALKDKKIHINETNKNKSKGTKFIHSGQYREEATLKGSHPF